MCICLDQCLPPPCKACIQTYLRLLHLLLTCLPHSLFPVPTFTPRHSAVIASSIHRHSVPATCALTYSCSAFAPGAPSNTASAPTRGICSFCANRASVEDGNGTRRVGNVLTDSLSGEFLGSVERCTSVGICACAGEEEGLGWVRMIKLKGRRLVFAASLSFLEILQAAVGGAVRAARASRWRVILFRPMRMCLDISGGLGAGSVVVSGPVGAVARLRFLPLEGVMCVRRWSPRGEMRLWGVRD